MTDLESTKRRPGVASFAVVLFALSVLALMAFGDSESQRIKQCGYACKTSGVEMGGYDPVAGCRCGFADGGAP